MFFCLVLVLVFGMIYSLSDDSFKVSGNAESGLNIFEGIYFSVVTITTLGYGEILPLNWWGQLLVIFETLLGVFCLGLLLTSIGYSLGLRQSAIQKEEHEFAISLKNKISLVRLASRIQTFLERYDNNQAPIGMSGGIVYFFKDAGFIMSRTISFPDYYFKEAAVNHENISPDFSKLLARAVEGYVARMEDLLAQHRSDIEKIEIVDDIAAHLHFCRRQIDELDRIDLKDEGTKQFVEISINQFSDVIYAGITLLQKLLALSDHMIDGATLRYSPNPYEPYDQIKAKGLWNRISTYVGL